MGRDYVTLTLMASVYVTLTLLVARPIVRGHRHHHTPTAQRLLSWRKTIIRTAVKVTAVSVTEKDRRASNTRNTAGSIRDEWSDAMETINLSQDLDVHLWFADLGEGAFEEIHIDEGYIYIIIITELKDYTELMAKVLRERILHGAPTYNRAVAGDDAEIAEEEEHGSVEGWFSALDLAASTSQEEHFDSIVDGMLHRSVMDEDSKIALDARLDETARLSRGDLGDDIRLVSRGDYDRVLLVNVIEEVAEAVHRATPHTCRGTAS